MLKASISLWSADLMNLESEIRRAEPYADSFHIDVADGHYAPLLVFFPDMVAAIREITKVPLEVHLIVESPEKWVGTFAEAGADSIVFYPDSTVNPTPVIERIKSHGLQTGVSLALAHSVSQVEPYIQDLDIVVVLGTDAGVKGVTTPDVKAYRKIDQLVRLRAEQGLNFEIEADGAVRRETVPLLRQAGADIVVPGSLMFGNDMKETSQWLRSL